MTCFSRHEENEFILLLQNTIRKIRKNTLTPEEKKHLFQFYLQCSFPEPEGDMTEEQMRQNMMLGWYISTLFQSKDN